jgi:hypothetical protein
VKRARLTASDGVEVGVEARIVWGRVSQNSSE